MSANKNNYYLPEPSLWPIKGSIALIFLTVGAANWLHGKTFGPYLTLFGLLGVFYMMFGWFGKVIQENRQGLSTGKDVNRSFRWGMVWFIFSEVMFFGAFFGALFFTRIYSLPLLGGHGEHTMTHLYLWPNFKAVWPLLHNPDPSQFLGPKGVIETWGLPAINTLILLTSGATITVAHWGVLKDKRKQMLTGQLLTILLGISFLCMQAHEYTEAYMHKGLTLASGIYGTTFFMLTGFHALHVTIGTIALIVIFVRMLKNDFSSHNHYAFEAVSWYWHFVDVVWLLLFIFVYWL